MIKKKAQGLSLNTIIIAALVIMVLVILALVFTGQMGSFGTSTKSCAAKGGQCKEAPCPEGESSPLLGGGECPEDQVCCVPDIV